tara:strand:- start:70 stop:1059 length:990 start_codon:yes stop_codon:yes gene_type:complete
MDYKNKIPWFERDKDIFKKTSNHHAYIFAGPKGIGKNLFTLEIAKGFLCNAKPNIEICNECKSCHLFDESNHPDFYSIKTIEDKKQISINQIREIQEPLYESSFMGSKKVFLINPLEKLTREAFDSFLKNLEEPPSNSVFLLVSHRYQTLPLTIKSRCIQISMQIPEKKQIEIWLENQTKHKEKIESAILFSKGKPLVAAEMINLEVNVTRKDFIKDISELIKTGNNLLQISEHWPKDKDSMLLKLEWMSDLLMDCIRHKFLTENQETFQDTDNISSYLSEKVEADKFFSLLEKTNSFWSLFNSETNLRADYQLQALLVEWTESVGLTR